MLFKKIIKPRAFIPFSLIFLFLIFAGILALTQEAPDDTDLRAFDFAPELPPLFEQPSAGDEYTEPAALPIWIPPAQPRWFKSNAGGMTLEENESRLAALRNEYALVIDYVPSDEIEPRLLPFFEDNYTIEIRVLYERGEESRRQWLLRDEQDNVRVNAVFRPVPAANESGEIEEEIIEEPLVEAQLAEEALAETALTEEVLTEGEAAETPDEAPPDMMTPEAPLISELTESRGFIEVYNNKAQIIADHWLYEDNGELFITYFYNKNTLIKSETKMRKSGDMSDEYFALYSDSYRYNRSYSLRSVERLYMAPAETEPVRLVFPSRILEAAADSNFFSEKLSFSSEFFGNDTVGEGFRIVYDTDSRGRILSQTMINDSDEVMWVLTNTWSGDRILSVLKIEGEDEKLTEYEYDADGNRIVQRDINNGILERQVHSEGASEIEELYLNGELVLRAYWEDGRKISEERVRRR